MKQPKINIPKTRIETVFDAIGITVYILLIIYLITQYSALPDKVPGHFNAAGEADRWGSKMELFILPVIGAVLWLFLSVLEKYPHTFNYFNLREDNIAAQYKNGRLMINILKNEIIFFFSYIAYQMIQSAKGVSDGLGTAFLPVFLMVIVGTTIAFTLRMLKL